MGFAELLTIVFVILRATSVIDWSWWLVFLPEIIAGILYVTLIIIYVICARKQRKEFDKEFRRNAEEILKNERW